MSMGLKTYELFDMAIKADRPVHILLNGLNIFGSELFWLSYASWFGGRSIAGVAVHNSRESIIIQSMIFSRSMPFHT